MRPKKALSQNFLIDVSTIEKLIDLAHIESNDKILEIGPGHGAITKRLLKKGIDVIAIELDKDLAQKLSAPHLTILHADALSIDYTQFGCNKVVANLPFQIATPLITQLIQLPFQSLTVIVQKEVAMRLCATVNTKAYSALTIQTQNFCDAQYLFTIAPTAFYPQPKITSAAIQLLPHKAKFPLDLDFVFTAFRQRRKMLKSSLKKLYPCIEQTMLKLGIDTRARPENLTIEDFYNLQKNLFA